MTFDKRVCSLSVRTFPRKLSARICRLFILSGEYPGWVVTLNILAVSISLDVKNETILVCGEFALSLNFVSEKLPQPQSKTVVKKQVGVEYNFISNS